MPQRPAEAVLARCRSPGPSERRNAGQGPGLAAATGPSSSNSISRQAPKRLAVCWPPTWMHMGEDSATLLLLVIVVMVDPRAASSCSNRPARTAARGERPLPGRPGFKQLQPATPLQPLFRRKRHGAAEA